MAIELRRIVLRQLRLLRANAQEVSFNHALLRWEHQTRSRILFPPGSQSIRQTPLQGDHAGLARLGAEIVPGLVADRGRRTRAEARLSSFILARSLSACIRFMLPLARFA